MAVVFVAAVLNHSQKYRLSKFDITERTMQTLNDDQVILCIVVCTCYSYLPLYVWHI